MADDERRGSYQSSPPSQWGQSPHIYPHSHHGTPAQEYSGFNFSNTTTPTIPILPMEPGAFGAVLSQAQQPHQLPHHRQMPPQLQPLMVPPWPSMLGSQQVQHPAYQPLFAPPVQPIQPMSHGAIPMPVVAPSLRSASMPRKTLTDADRRRMCQYQEDHPLAKQTEIGAIFGVERSTVSKVLKQKDKYLVQDDDSRSSIKRVKGNRSPDIERALANWAKNQQKRGLPLDDSLIRDKARAFASTTSSPESHPALSSSWIEKFKLKHNLLGARLSRKGSLAPDDAEGLSTATVSSSSQSQTPSGTSPVSPSHASALGSPPELHSAQSQESLKNDESPDSYIDYGRHDVFHSQSTTSLNSAFTDTAPSSFSPNGPMSPTSPFFTTPDSGTAPSPFIPSAPPTARLILPAAQNVINPHQHRPRSQTFPLLDSSSSTEAATPTKFVNSTNNTLDLAMIDDEATTDDVGIITTTTAETAVLLSHFDDQPNYHTVSPAEMMRPPPLPAHVLNTNLQLSRQSTPGGTSPEEARRALEIVMGYIDQQPQGFLDFQESVHMGKLMQKLQVGPQSQSQSRRPSVG